MGGLRGNEGAGVWEELGGDGYEGPLKLLNKQVLLNKNRLIYQHIQLYRDVIICKHGVLNKIHGFSITCYFTMWV